MERFLQNLVGILFGNVCVQGIQRPSEAFFDLLCFVAHFSQDSDCMQVRGGKNKCGAECGGATSQRDLWCIYGETILLLSKV